MTVPFRDLKRLHEIGRDSSRSRLESALDSATFARPNQWIEDFEASYADYCGVDHAVATASGTAALMLTYLALGIGPGDEVVTAANTFVATIEPALALGATVRLADVDPETHLMSQEAALALVTPRTKAIVPFHAYGRLADLSLLRRETSRLGITLVEEACHAPGATRNGRMAGSFGDCAVFSFGPTKPLAGLGEGGAVVTNDSQLALRLRRWNDHGRTGGEHLEIGLNFRMHPMEAAYLTERLKLLPEFLEERRALAHVYNDAFAPYGVVKNPDVTDYSAHSYYVYVLDVPERRRFTELLTEHGIGWDIHYPRAIYELPAHQKMFADLDFANCSALQRRIVSLPMITGLTELERNQVVSCVCDALAEVSPDH
ncbi:DegT/DnrJ/EryC1/StrS family aminotransferase [Kribbella yunnanensis]|uniref:DegT/DnrJ/EryC1/StrS family aminotransferase n=1 Tax=Kribbella yunnanensis TaxID=190194 RepID=A0ABP4TQ01_9ACTN